MDKTRILGVIPARYNSSRFPGKLLAPLMGKTVLERTYDNARRSSLFDKLIIATDDERIASHAAAFGATVAMTPSYCTSGTERIAALLRADTTLESYPVVVNVQGDEPCIAPALLHTVVEALLANPAAAIATLVAPLDSAAAWHSSSVVKCIRDQTGKALYFSRAPIPGGKNGLQWHCDLPVFRHIGIYAYRSPFLQRYSELTDTPLQKHEDLEQLKVLEHGFTIATAVVNETGLGVDTPEDLKILEQLLCTVNFSSSLAESAPH